VRILLTTWNAPSHLFPMVPLVWAFRTAGHDVRIAAPPSCAAAITAAGLTPTVVGREAPATEQARKTVVGALNREAAWPSDWVIHPDRLTDAQRGLVAALARKNLAIADAMLDDLLDVARDFRPDLLVTDTICYAGTVVAAKLDIPLVSQMWGTPAPIRAEMLDLGSAPLPEYAALFERIGAPIRTEPLAWIDPLPPTAQLPFCGQRIGQGFVPYNGPGVLPEWLLRPADRPRICVSWGVTAHRDGTPEVPETFRRAFDAARELDAEVVAAVPQAWPGLAGLLPPGSRIVEFLPLHLVLPSCDAFVHHGGGGSALVAAWSGAPQLILALRPVQMLVGERLAATGAALYRPERELAAAGEAATGVLTDDLGALLGKPEPRAAANRLAAEIGRQPTPAAIVPRLATLAGRL